MATIGGKELLSTRPGLQPWPVCVCGGGGGGTLLPGALRFPSGPGGQPLPTVALPSGEEMEAGPLFQEIMGGPAEMSLLPSPEFFPPYCHEMKQNRRKQKSWEILGGLPHFGLPAASWRVLGLGLDPPSFSGRSSLHFQGPLP